MSIETLDHLSLLEISGDDALTFLQGQLTNDINTATAAWQYSGYCNPKGRLLSLFKLWQHENTIYALLAKDSVEAITKRLKMYVMRSKVDISVSEHKCYGVIGDKSKLAKLINTSDLSDQLDNEQYSFYSNGSEHVLSFGDRFLCVVPNIENDHPNKGQWQTQNILNGLPEVSASSTELFIPQMLNLDILGGINFKKGCYTGQEIVARMHYLGKLKQRMFVCKLNSSEPNINIGDKIFTDQSLSKSAGHIASIKGENALVVLRTESSSSETLYLDSDTTLSINETQPYSLESDKQS